MEKRKTVLKIGARRKSISHSFFNGSCDFFVGIQSVFAKDFAPRFRMRAQLAVVPLASVVARDSNPRGRRHDLVETVPSIREVNR